MTQPPAAARPHRISLIVAMSENGVIGRDNDLPWRLPSDLRRVKRLTLGHSILMGRRTFESIGRPLPQRRSLVLSRDATTRIEGAEVVPSFAAALALTAGEPEIFVFGGAEVFRRALPSADRLYVTLVHAEVAGDVRFPSWDATAWDLVDDERHPADERHAFDYSFRTYERPVGVERAPT